MMTMMMMDGNRVTGVRKWDFLERRIRRIELDYLREGVRGII